MNALSTIMTQAQEAAQHHEPVMVIAQVFQGIMQVHLIKHDQALVLQKKLGGKVGERTDGT